MRSRHGTDLQFTTVFADVIAHRHTVEGLENLPRHRQRTLARRIEQSLAPGAIEQLDPEGLLQVAHLRADRRLGQANVHTGRCERAVARHRNEGFQFSQHDHPRLIEII
ncbi:hypothetical protein D3C87_1585700 [compost metagenome]